MPRSGKDWWRVVAAGCAAPLLAGCLHPFPSLVAPPRAEGVWVAASHHRDGVQPVSAEQPESAAGPGEADAVARQQPDGGSPIHATPVQPNSPAAKPQFTLPADLPGADAPPVRLPRFRNEPLAERDKAIQASYPPLPAVPSIGPRPPAADGKVWTLAELQALAIERSPALRRARQDVEAARGAMVQAGLPPNPTAGYQADQWQPGPKPRYNSGQQGGYVQQLIKTAGKLQLAQAVAAFDVVKAEIALRRAQIDLLTAVRGYYFALLVAEEGVRVNRAMVDLAAEAYRLQLRLVRSGEAAGYEPLQLYSQLVQAQNYLVQSEARYRYAWKQLAATLNAPEMPPQAMAARASMVIPVFEFERAKARLLETHTDLLTARQNIEQTRVDIRLAEKTRIPDLHTQVAAQHDNAAGNDQFNLQLGLNLPVWDRNQGRIYQAKAQLASFGEGLRSRQNELVAMLAEAFGRYESSRRLVENYRERVLPNLARAYRSIQDRYQAEPAKVSFNDVVVGQLSYGSALNAYMTALGSQWTSVVDIANLIQLDELPVPEDTCPEPKTPAIEVLPVVPPLPKN